VSKRASPVLIGAFVVGALALGVVTVLLLAGGELFRERRSHVMYFEGAAQGLQIGAPVMFLGVKVGTVKRIQLGLDEQSGKFTVPVTAEIQANVVVRTRNGEAIDLRERETLGRLVERGLRARLRMQSLLTGQLYVDLDFHPDKPARYVSLDPDASEIPTIPTTVQELTTKLESFPADRFLADIAAIGESINKVFGDPAARDLPKRMQTALRSLESLALKLDAQVAPVSGAVRADLSELRKTLVAAQSALARMETAARNVDALARPDGELVKNLNRGSEELAAAARAIRALTEDEAPTVENLNVTLREISAAARALRLLAETIEQQPESVIKGKVEEQR